MQILIYLLAIIIVLYAQMKVQSAYSKFSRIHSATGYKGYEIARMVLDSNGLYDVKVEMTRGVLSDHYDPRSRVVRLSEEIYHGSTIASLAVATHEVGHAIQHATNYQALVFRNTILPFAQIGSSLGWVAIMIGFLTSSANILYIGIFLLLGLALFQFATLPVEFDASNRALKILGNGYLPSNELDGAKEMLSAAALTYVAALASTLLNILRIVLIARNRD